VVTTKGGYCFGNGYRFGNRVTDSVTPVWGVATTDTLADAGARRCLSPAVNCGRLRADVRHLSAHVPEKAFGKALGNGIERVSGRLPETLRKGSDLKSYPLRISPEGYMQCKYPWLPLG
jgi:hypothetical protein